MYILFDKRIVIFIIFKIAAGDNPGRLQGPFIKGILTAVISLQDERYGEHYQESVLKVSTFKRVKQYN